MVRYTPVRPTAKIKATVEATVVSQKLNGNLDGVGTDCSTTVFAPSISFSFSLSFSSLPYLEEREKERQEFNTDKEYWWLEEYMYIKGTNQPTHIFLFIFFYVTLLSDFIILTYKQIISIWNIIKSKFILFDQISFVKIQILQTLDKYMA